jgi:hypothetical protein
MAGLLLMGCATSQTDAYGYSKRSYFGWVDVTQYSRPEAETTAEMKPAITPRIERVKTIGLRFQNGFSIGYFDDSQIELPMECHLVIVVKELAQLDHIFAAYPKLAKELKPCVKPLDY